MDRKYEIRPGDRVTFSVWPEWVENLHAESKEVFGIAFGKHHRVCGFDRDGDLVLEIQVADGMFGGGRHQINLELEFVTPSRKVRRRGTSWRKKGKMVTRLHGLTYRGNPPE